MFLNFVQSSRKRKGMNDGAPYFQMLVQRFDLELLDDGENERVKVELTRARFGPLIKLKTRRINWHRCNKSSKYKPNFPPPFGTFDPNIQQ